MKKTLLKLCLILSITLTLSSCAAGLTGMMNSATSLNSNNFSYVERDLRGKAQATYVFGIGGMNKEAIVSEAKMQMLKNHQLEDGQALANITVDFKYSNFLGIIATTKCYVTADIVVFE